MFSKGQKVVCVNDEFPELVRALYSQLPRKGAVYTVRAVYIGRGGLVRAAGGGGASDGEIGVLLEELVNPRDPTLKKGLNGELGFNSERFAPLQYDEDGAVRVEEEEDEILVPG